MKDIRLILKDIPWFVKNSFDYMKGRNKLIVCIKMPFVYFRWIKFMIDGGAYDVSGIMQ